MASTTAKLTQEPLQHAQKVALFDTHAERATIALRRQNDFHYDTFGKKESIKIKAHSNF
jgi:hypothetical protein